MATVNPIQVEKVLKGIHYPASKEDLIKRAESNAVNDDVRTMLLQLPDQTYLSTIDVTKAVGVIDAPSDKPKRTVISANPIQVESYLKGIRYPADLAKLTELATQNGADERVLTTLSQLPDQTFNSTLEVSEAVGQVDRQTN